MALLSTTWNLNETFQVPRNLTTATLLLVATPDFHFLKNLPKLKRLKMVGYRDSMAEATQSEKMEGVQLQTLSQLVFFRGITGGSSYNYKLAMDIFVKSMPNLRVLKCPLTNQVFRVVCQHWGNLKVIGDNAQNDEILDDEGVTGIVPGGESRLPNITLLKYLRKFETIHTLTDKAVYDGFLQLEHLTDLEIFDDAMSSEARAALSSKFGPQIFHAHQRSVERYFFDDDAEDPDRLVEERLKVQMLAKDYGIILGEESDLYGDEIGCPIPIE